MAGSETHEQQKRLEDALRHAQPAEWVLDMIDRYRRTGRCRPEDLRRLLGDQTQAVQIGGDSSVDIYVNALKPK